MNIDIDLTATQAREMSKEYILYIIYENIRKSCRMGRTRTSVLLNGYDNEDIIKTAIMSLSAKGFGVRHKGGALDISW